MKIIRTVKLNHIFLETSFRKQNDSQMKADLRKNGLQSPLVVEQRNQNDYVLVEGYRRFIALKSLGIREADCIVEKYTSEDKRLIKRLRKELQIKKRTFDEMERLIASLLPRYKTEEIAALCNVSIGTINRYIDAIDVKIEWIERAKAANVGRHGLTIIHKMKISESLKEHIVDLYITKEINTKMLREVFIKAIKEKEFLNLSEHQQINVIKKIINKVNNSYENIILLIHKESLYNRYNPSSHALIYQTVLNKIDEIDTIFHNPVFMYNLSEQQKKRIIMEIGSLDRQMNPLTNRVALPYKQNIAIVE